MGGLVSGLMRAAHNHAARRHTKDGRSSDRGRQVGPSDAQRQARDSSTMCKLCLPLQ